VLNVLADTGVWYAACDPRDQYHSRALSMADYLEKHHVLVPWPIVYETLCTRFVKNVPALQRFSIYLKKSHLTYLKDADYVDSAYALAIQSSLVRGRWLSMVDCVIRLMLDDDNVKIHGLLTFNPNDFSDICRRRRIEIISGDQDRARPTPSTR
jgi:predicted nucleic acid-binding protein